MVVEEEGVVGLLLTLEEVVVEVEGLQILLEQVLEKEVQQIQLVLELVVVMEECSGTEEVEGEVVFCTLHWTWNHLVSAVVPLQAGEQDGVEADQVVLPLLHDVCCVMEED